MIDLDDVEKKATAGEPIPPATVLELVAELRRLREVAATVDLDSVGLTTRSGR